MNLQGKASDEWDLAYVCPVALAVDAAVGDEQGGSGHPSADER